MILVRSLIFQTWFFLSVCVAATVIFCCRPLPHRLRFGTARAWGRSMLWAGRVLCGLRYTVEGREHIPDEPSVILIKHSSVFETYAQLVLFPPQTWVVKRELMWIPIIGWGLAALKSIAIDRGAGRVAVSQVIAQGRERLAEGIWVTVFPEGTRVAPGTTRKYGISGAALASEVGCPVVPVAHNAGDLWPRRGLRKRPGLIRICIGPPIDPAGRAPREINAAVRQWIESRMAEISDRYRDAGYGRGARGADAGAPSDVEV